MSFSSDVAFTPAVKAVQERKGSRQSYARTEESGSWKTHITADLRAFIEAQTSVFLATASSQGQPYIQHRGGPPGFLRVLDEHTLGFVDFVGNRQYITLGNLLPRRFEAADVAAAIEERDQAALESQLAEIRATPLL